jgi:hypothetical protein
MSFAHEESTAGIRGSEDFEAAAARNATTGFNIALAAAPRTVAGGTPPG